MDIKRFVIAASFIILTMFAYSQNSISEMYAHSKSSSQQAEKAKYYIEGDYSVNLVNGQFEYKLENIVSKGITFTYEDYKIGEERDEFEVFYFDHANTDYPGGFDGGLKFWKWDKNNNKWQIDSETIDGELQASKNKVMTIMLVLDCSTSLGDKFDDLKNYAERFIDIIYEKSHDGNVRLGIIGFNTMSYTENTVYPITELNQKSYYSMKSFIDRLKKDKQTAMYYAMRLASDYMEDYVNNIELEENVEYDGSYIVTFTDGYDNNSRDPEIGIPADGLLNPYYKYVKEKCLTKELKGKPIESFVIAVEGNDVGGNAQRFREVLSGLSYDDDHFKLADNFDQLEDKFNEIAKNLIDRWNNLVCFVPPSYYGKVRWTLGKAPVPKTDKPYKFSIGAIAVNINGLSMKYFTGRRWAMQTDIGISFFEIEKSRYYYTSYYGGYYGKGTQKINAVMLHQTFMWEPRLVESDGLNLHGMFGAGVGVGIADDSFEMAPQGIAGLEFIFGIPLTLQLDLRPMYYMKVVDDFKIGFNISARYYFK